MRGKGPAGTPSPTLITAEWPRSIVIRELLLAHEDSVFRRDAVPQAVKGLLDGSGRCQVE